MTHNEILKITQEYLKKTNENIIGVGYGYKTVNDVITNDKSIIFSVKEKKQKELLTEEELLPSNIIISGDNILTDVVQQDIKLLCDPTFYSWQSTPPSNRNIFRPLKSGVSCSAIPSMSGTTGTMGFLAIDNDTNTLVGVSNNHVLIKDAFISSEQDITGELSSIENEQTNQPHENLNDNYIIGAVKRYKPIQCPPYYNTVDGALTTIRSGSTYINTGISYKQENLSDNITGIGLDFATTEEINNLLTSDPFLYSAGRTTGGKGEDATKLRIYSVAETITVDFNKQGNQTSVFFSDLIVFVATTGTTKPFSKCQYPIYSGDSGSALIADINGTKKIIGLCFAGNEYYGFACRIDHVASQLNISAWKGENINYSDEIRNEYIVNGLSDAEYIDHGGNRYYQAGIRIIS